MGRSRRSGGRLIRRTVAVSVLLSAVIGAAFSLLMLAIDDLRDSEERAKHALEVLVARTGWSGWSSTSNRRSAGSSSPVNPDS